MRMRNTKVLISGYLGFDNSGDESILQAINTSIKESNVSVDLTAFSSNPKKTKANHQINSLHSFNPISIISGIIKNDIILSGGGNLIQDKTSSRSLWYYLFIILLGKLFRKKVMLYSNGIGPLTKKMNKCLVKGIVNNVDIITLRDPLSKETLEQLGVVKPPIYITADPVFLLKPVNEKRLEQILHKEGVEHNRKLLGITIRTWGNNKQLKAFALLCDKMIDALDLDIVFVPMQYPQDLKTSEKVVSLMGHKAKIIKHHYVPNEQISIIGAMDIILSMRLHTLIFAGIVAVPMVGLIYDPKIKDYLSQVEMPYYEDINQINSEEVIGIIKNIVGDYEHYKLLLKNKSNALKEKAKLNNYYLSELIQK